MYCCDTNKLEAVLLGKMKLTHIPDLACQEVSKLSRLKRLVKAAFRGNARILLTLNGGNILTMTVNDAAFDEEKAN